jgi:hypothetical protein
MSTGCAAARRQNFFDHPTILAPIIAYVGEAMREATGGHWEMRSWEFREGDDRSPGTQKDHVLIGLKLPRGTSLLFDEKRSPRQGGPC